MLNEIFLVVRLFVYSETLISFLLKNQVRISSIEIEILLGRLVSILRKSEDLKRWKNRPS